eukprot:4883998-Pleurochrysis_carterae.AAC.2
MVPRQHSAIDQLRSAHRRAWLHLALTIPRRARCLAGSKCIPSAYLNIKSKNLSLARQSCEWYQRSSLQEASLHAFRMRVHPFPSLLRRFLPAIISAGHPQLSRLALRPRLAH